LPPEPLTLAFDTSVAHCAAALLFGDQIVAQREENMVKGQAERLFGMLEDLLKDAGSDWPELHRIGVGIGPGNFTGVRISVSGARGLALSLGIPAIGVSTFQALTLDLPGPIFASVDGRAGRLYLQKFDGQHPHDPQTASEGALPADLFGDNMQIVGHISDAIAAQTGAKIRQPVHPFAVAIARIAARTDTANTRRPAPLYMAAPDAAPARDIAPTILP